MDRFKGLWHFEPSLEQSARGRRRMRQGSCAAVVVVLMLVCDWRDDGLRHLRRIRSAANGLRVPFAESQLLSVDQRANRPCCTGCSLREAAGCAAESGENRLSRGSCCSGHLQLCLICERSTLSFGRTRIDRPIKVFVILCIFVLNLNVVCHASTSASLLLLQLLLFR